MFDWKTIARAYNLHLVMSVKSFQMNFQTGKLDSLIEAYTDEIGHFACQVYLIRLGSDRAYHICEMGGSREYWDETHIPELLDQIPFYDRIGLRFKDTPQITTTKPVTIVATGNNSVAAGGNITIGGVDIERCDE